MNVIHQTISAALAGGVLFLTSATGAPAAGSMMSASGSMSPDATFSMKFSQAGAAEIAMARAALKDSTNPHVLTFAHKMIADHTMAGNKLAMLAKPMGYETPMTPDPVSASMAKPLMMMTGASFDRTYKGDNIIGHKKALALLQQEVSSGKNAKLVSYARLQIPIVEMHLTMAEALPTT